MTTEGDSKEGKPNEEPGKEGEGNAGKPAGAAGDEPKGEEAGKGLPKELKDEIRAFVREITGQANPKPPAKDGDGGSPNRPVSRLRQIEDEAERAVREAAERVFKEKAHEDSHKKLEHAAEAPPKEKGKSPLLQRILWGE